MTRRALNVNRLLLWYERLTRQTITDYVDFSKGNLNKARVARDANIGYKALTDKFNGNPELQEKFVELQSELRNRGWLSQLPESDKLEGSKENPATVDRASLELGKAKARIATLEKQLAECNARLLKTESEMSSLSEFREVMLELGLSSK
jgi:hypothetical protein